MNNNFKNIEATQITKQIKKNSCNHDWNHFKKVTFLKEKKYKYK